MRLVLLAAVLAIGCGDDDRPSADAMPDADARADAGEGGIDADASPDATDDAELDADAEPDAMPDAMPECMGMPNGTRCGDDEASFCQDEACALSTCGDGFVDSRMDEQCDDGNGTSGDGCEPGVCLYSCEAHGDCDDGDACSGAETCSAALHRCQAAENAPAGTPCTLGEGLGVCDSDAECIEAGCGNAVVEDGEQCDDDNDVETDGCKSDCTLTCLVDEDCNDGNACDGTEHCEGALCVEGTDPITCPSDDNACTVEVCNPLAGDVDTDGEVDDDDRCAPVVIDADEDGYSPTSAGACGTDCDDENAAVNPSVGEICGNGVDDNCAGGIDEGMPTWYVDCDGDTYSASLSGARTQCEIPTIDAGCPGVTRWTTRRPADATTTDCADTDDQARPFAMPYRFMPVMGVTDGARDYDYNCNSVEEPRFNGAAALLCTAGSGRCNGSGWTGGAAACGASAQWRNCGYNGSGGCVQLSVGPLRQECR